MNEVAPLKVAALTSGLLFLIVLAFGLGIVFALLRSRSLGKVAVEFGWLAAPVIVVGTFTGISLLGRPVVESSQPKPAPFESVFPGPVPGPQAVIPVPTDDRTTTASADEKTHRPAWIDQPRTYDGISEQLVIASQQYTTREEAEAELSSRTAQLLTGDLQQLHLGSGLSSWTPAPAEIRRVMVKQQYVEAIERDFGNFFHPMYRVWWQVELSPEVRTQFLPAWKQGLTANRIQRVGMAAGSLVLAASLITMYRRLNVLMRGTWSSLAPKILTSAIAALWVMVMIYQFRSMNL